MNQLVKVTNEKAVTSSRQVAEYFGKEHYYVMDTIRNILKDEPSTSTEFSIHIYIHEQNKQACEEYLMTKDGFVILVMGFGGKETLKIKLDYMAEFNKMEETLSIDLRERVNTLEEKLNSLIKPKSTSKLYLQDNSVHSFIEEKCIISDSEATRIKYSEIYEAYRQFCRDQGFVCVNPKNFTRILEQKNKAVKKPARINGKTENCFCKIKLRYH